MANRHAPPFYEKIQIPCGKGAIACQTVAGRRARVVEYEPTGDYNLHPDKVVETIDRQWGAEGKSIFTFTKFGQQGRIVSGNVDNIARRTSTSETLSGTKQNVWGKRRRVHRDVYQSIVDRIRQDGDVDPDLVEEELAKDLWDQQPLKTPPESRTHWNPAIDDNVAKFERELRGGYAGASGRGHNDRASSAMTRERVDSDKLRRCYNALGVAQGASLDECKRARQANLLHAHPDHGGDKNSAAQRIAQIMDSYKYIAKWHHKRGTTGERVETNGPS